MQDMCLNEDFHPLDIHTAASVGDLESVKDLIHRFVEKFAQIKVQQHFHTSYQCDRITDWKLELLCLLFNY